jgi:hypothetical protein
VLVNHQTLLALILGVVNDSTEAFGEMETPATVPDTANVDDGVGVPGMLGSDQLGVDTEVRLATDCMEAKEGV